MKSRTSRRSRGAGAATSGSSAQESWGPKKSTAITRRGEGADELRPHLRQRLQAEQAQGVDRVDDLRDGNSATSWMSVWWKVTEPLMRSFSARRQRGCRRCRRHGPASRAGRTGESAPAPAPRSSTTLTAVTSAAEIAFPRADGRDGPRRSVRRRPVNLLRRVHACQAPPCSFPFQLPVTQAASTVTGEQFPGAPPRTPLGWRDDGHPCRIAAMPAHLTAHRAEARTRAAQVVVLEQSPRPRPASHRVDLFTRRPTRRPAVVRSWPVRAGRTLTPGPPPTVAKGDMDRGPALPRAAAAALAGGESPRPSHHWFRRDARAFRELDRPRLQSFHSVAAPGALDARGRGASRVRGAASPASSSPRPSDLVIAVSDAEARTVVGATASPASASPWSARRGRGPLTPARRAGPAPPHPPVHRAIEAAEGPRPALGSSPGSTPHGARGSCWRLRRPAFAEYQSPGAGEGARRRGPGRDDGTLTAISSPRRCAAPARCC